ncbi:MAG: hypothetical protein K2F59_03290 [Eubacteriales bacterium]|nr:hypothetical protein [Eubacteriales bacterium]
MINQFRKILRYSHNMLDDEININVEACLQDLRRRGITKLDVSDPLIFRAVVLYLKNCVDFDNNGSRYEKSYEELARALSCSGGYIDV